MTGTRATWTSFVLPLNGCHLTWYGLVRERSQGLRHSSQSWRTSPTEGECARQCPEPGPSSPKGMMEEGQSSSQGLESSKKAQKPVPGYRLGCANRFGTPGDLACGIISGWGGGGDFGPTQQVECIIRAVIRDRTKGDSTMVAIPGPPANLEDISKERRRKAAQALVVLLELGETSKFITAGCSQSAAAFNSYV